MKTQFYKWLALVAVLISLVFVATNVGAKKPPKDPPPNQDDPCSKLTSFSPTAINAEASESVEISS